MEAQRGAGFPQRTGSEKTLASLRGAVDSMTGLVEPKVLLQPVLPMPSARLELHDLFGIASRQDQIPWEKFKDGVEIYRLYGDGITGPTAALLRFRKAGRVPLHEHAGYEHVIVLAGSQSDQKGAAEAGTLIINPPGSRHSVVGEAGCIVLAIYEKPVQFLADAPLVASAVVKG
jgi:quercetin dioxygenase-like cupin family protein